MKLISNKRKSWLIYLILAISYTISGLFLSNIASQTQVVSVWLPAGIALVGCYLWWWRFIPALFIASVSFNFFTHANAKSFNLVSNMSLEITIMAFGACLQAIVGAYILRYKIGNPLKLQSDFRAFAFIFIIGILVSLISPNIGVFALSQFNPSYNYDNHWHNVFLWWLGDSLGVLLATPFLLSFLNLSKLNEQKRKAQFLVLTTACLLFIFVTLTALLFSSSNRENANQLAKKELKVIENSLYRQLNNSLVSIQTLANFIQTSPSIDRQSFKVFANQIMKNETSIQAMSWNPIIEQEQISQFENTLSELYLKPIKIKGKQLRPEDPLVVVKLITPEFENRNAIGFNVYSNQKRKSVLLNAQLRHQPMATPIIQLIQSTKPEAGYLLFAPVYQINPVTKNRELRGYATGIFLVKKIINHIFGLSQNKMFDYELYEKDAKKSFLTNTKNTYVSLDKTGAMKSLVFNLAGQVWHMNLVPNKEFLSHYQSRLEVLLFIFQLVITSFVMLLILLMNNRQTILNSLVKKNTKALKKAKLQSENTSLAKSRFLTNMSHEIRTPLNTVIGFTQLSKQTHNHTELIPFIDKIEFSAKNLLDIINDILDIAKMESGKLTLEHNHFDMHALLNRINFSFESTANAAGIGWKINDNLPKNLWYQGDNIRIEQILTNLCNNAIKFTQKGEILVEAQLIELNLTVAHLILTITDTSEGLKPEVIINLFNSFTQTDFSPSKRFGATGLDLAIAKKLSHLMNGDITIQNKPNQGSTFTFHMKLETQKHPPELAQKTTSTDLTNLKVLVAEDDLSNQTLIKAMLESFHIIPTLVENGLEAVNMAKTKEFDLILMDCQMPILNGYQATQKIRESPNTQNIPIIALTADVMPEDKTRALDVGCNAHLSKPIDIIKLQTCLKEHAP